MSKNEVPQDFLAIFVLFCPFAIFPKRT